MARTYTITAQDVITRVRDITQDSRTVPYRNTDAELLRWINDAVNAVLVAIPGLFSKIGSHTCTAGYWQNIELTRAHKLMEVIGVPVADVRALTQFMPGWMTAPNGAIENWMPVPDSPLSFYCTPPSASGQALPVLYSESPEPLVAVTDLVPLPETYLASLVAYCVSRSESKDDEHVNSNRSAQFLAEFVASVKGA